MSYIADAITSAFMSFVMWVAVGSLVAGGIIGFLLHMWLS